MSGEPGRLNAERAAEEKRGIVRWLRPEYQNRAVAAATQAAMIELGDQRTGSNADAAVVHAEKARLWPKDLPQRIAAVRDLVSATPAANDWTATDVARAFTGARKKDVEDVEAVLDSLAALGLLVTFSTGPSRRWRANA